MVSVKTAHDIPKEKIMDIMASIEHVTVAAPIKIGDVIGRSADKGPLSAIKNRKRTLEPQVAVVANAADTGVDIIATKDIAAV